MVPAELRAVLGFAALTALAGCGGSTETATPSIPFIAAVREHAGRVWMEREAKRRDLLYVATGDNVYVISYPRGELVGSLGVPGNDLCADRKGNVFVPSSGYVVLEYAHGGIYPLQTLHGGDVPLGCAVDPISGDLAVTQEASGAGDVAIFPQAKEPAALYRDPEIATFGLCGYDDQGNLFVDGTGSGNYLAELPKGRGEFRNYPLAMKFAAFGGIQWDGAHVAFSDPLSDTIYRLRFGRSSLRVTGATRIKGWVNSYSGHWPYIQTWLAKGTFIAQSSDLAELGLWRYPGGGRSDGTLGPFLTGNVDIYGVTLSTARR
jgi:hypothetical protein